MPSTAPGPEIEPRRDLPLPDVLELQRQVCARAGSALYDRLLAGMIHDVRRGGLCHELLGPWSANALADAVPLRFLAAVHRLVLEGRAPDLARFYPSAGGDDDGDPVPAFLAAVAEHRGAVRSGMHLGVQTNEVGRAAALMGAFHLVSKRSGLPLRLLEVGASAGLLLRWDRYRYRVAGMPMRWGDADGGQDVDGPVFDDPWVGDPPALDPHLRVASRGGCDVAPIDPTIDEGVVRLRSFLWPDQVERRRHLDAAVAVARQVPATVETADAGAWIEDRLREPAVGVATVVYHSIVLQYLPRPSFHRMRSAITRAGASATAEAPVHWLRMEPAGPAADLRLRSWDGRAEGADEVLGTAGFHGPPISWAAP